jgi:hypothetical protein
MYPCVSCAPNESEQSAPSLSATDRAALAEVHEFLGNVAMENEDFATSADEFAKCLQVQLALHADATVAAPREREVAAAHSNLALSHLYVRTIRAVAC